MRHIIEPSGWNALLCPMEVGGSQNGGYWGVPCGWIARAISITNPNLAKSLITSMIDFYKANGVYEWISDEELNNLDYVASAALPLVDAIELLTSEK